MPLRAASAALLLLALTGSGCSYFKSSKRLDMQPFAENTVTAIGELRRLDRPLSWVRLRAYQSHPAVEEARAEYLPMRKLLQGVTTYSLQLVALNDARTSDARKIRELVRYVRETAPIALQQSEDGDDELLLTKARLEEVLQQMSAQETFLGAVGAAEPLVSAVQTRGLALSDRMATALAKASSTVEVLVQGHYASMVANREALVALQVQVVKASTLAERAALGDQAALEELRRDVPVAQELLQGPRRPTTRELQPVIDALAAQGARIQHALEQIKPEYEAYRESLAELDGMRAATTERARLERSLLLVWARSHRNLGRGVEVPAAFDLAKVLAAGASKAVNVVLPIP